MNLILFENLFPYTCLTPPSSLQGWYRLGQALLALDLAKEAAEVLSRGAALDAGYTHGFFFCLSLSQNS
jgi:hypothetical protein